MNQFLLSNPILAYVPFGGPLPINGNWYWPWLIIPLCLAVAIVYKTVRAQSISRLMRDSIIAAVWILVGLGGGAAALAGIVSLIR